MHDRLGVVASTIALLREAGYSVTTGTLSAAKLGWPQTRSRFFLVACKDSTSLAISDVMDALRDEPRSSLWAMEDLSDDGTDFMMESSEYSEENRRRIDWLFENDEYDLALAERPECHQAGTRYMAVYGRMYPDRPAPTITTGFMSPGQGRFIHPTRRRAITAREAARLQGFPDTYDFDPGELPSKRSLAKWIGDAVPMPLGHAAALSALVPVLSQGSVA